MIFLDVSMRSKKMSKKSGSGSMPNAFINIIGSTRLQNELLLSFLKEKTGLKGRCCPNLESILAIDAKKSSIPQLIILDCENIDMKNLLTSIHKFKCQSEPQCYFVLCNVEHASMIEKTAMENGIQGIFYNNDPMQLITKGICAVLNGELWYSRKALANCVPQSRSSDNSSMHPSMSRLTFIERQVLSYIASGYTRKHISDHLKISIHTVNSHIYNIYKKINVTNRLQATLWATKFLKSL
jgi:DNA-binding NarL/FixJ family response regulator